MGGVLEDGPLMLSLMNGLSVCFDNLLSGNGELFVEAGKSSLSICLSSALV